MRGGVVTDVREVGAAVGGQPAQVAPEPLETALDRVDVGVGEAGQQQSPGHVDDGRAGRRPVHADTGDPAALDDDVADAARGAGSRRTPLRCERP